MKITSFLCRTAAEAANLLLNYSKSHTFFWTLGWKHDQSLNASGYFSPISGVDFPLPRLPWFSNAFALRWPLRAEPGQTGHSDGCIRSQNDSKSCPIIGLNGVDQTPGIGVR